MRTIDVVTTSRADYGILLPVFRAAQAAPRVRLRVVVSGSHLVPKFGMTVRGIESDGFEIAARVEVLSRSDTAEATTTAMGRGVAGFGAHFAAQRPDLLVVLGDRFEMHAAALAALPFRLPVAHIHGGELSAGAFDDALRHSMTKLSHLHFVSIEEYARRVRQLGEESWRITVSGAPSLDNLRSVRLADREALGRAIGLRLAETFVLVTFHPATLDAGDPAIQARHLFRAIESLGLHCVVTMPNADPGGQAIRTVVRERATAGALLQSVENLGTDAYFSLMGLAAAMVGNSSSGIIEAASFELPVVNVGARQEGRTHGANVIDVPPTEDDIVNGLRIALQPQFKAGLKGLKNPYGDGHAADRIIERLVSVDLNPSLLIKRFVDMDVKAADANA